MAEQPVAQDGQRVTEAERSKARRVKEKLRIEYLERQKVSADKRREALRMWDRHDHSVRGFVDLPTSNVVEWWQAAFACDAVETAELVQHEALGERSIPVFRAPPANVDHEQWLTDTYLFLLRRALGAVAFMNEDWAFSKVGLDVEWMTSTTPDEAMRELRAALTAKELRPDSMDPYVVVDGPGAASSALWVKEWVLAEEDGTRARKKRRAKKSKATRTAQTALEWAMSTVDHEPVSVRDGVHALIRRLGKNGGAVVEEYEDAFESIGHMLDGSPRQYAIVELSQRLFKPRFGWPRFAPDDRGETIDVPGLSTPNAYCSLLCAIFTLHVEDLGYASVNTSFGPGLKIWQFIAPRQRARVEAVVRDELGPSFDCAPRDNTDVKSDDSTDDDKDYLDQGDPNVPRGERHEYARHSMQCRQAVSALDALVRPAFLREHRIESRYLTQMPGCTVSVEGDAFHQGFNLGRSLAVAVNARGSGFDDLGCNCVPSMGSVSYKSVKLTR